MFLNCLCSSIFLEKSRVYCPFLFTDCLQWSSIPMILASVFSTSQWFGTIKQFCTINVCFPKIKTKTSKTASLLFWQHRNNIFNPLTSGAPSCTRKKNHPENPVRPYAPVHKWLILIGCSLDTKSLGYLKYAETWHAWIKLSFETKGSFLRLLWDFWRIFEYSS